VSRLDRPERSVLKGTGAAGMAKNLISRVSVALLFASLLFSWGAGPGSAQAPTASGGTIGIVFLHGGTPLNPSWPGYGTLADALRKAGYKVEMPEMCWSRTRVFDRAFDDCLKEVDDAIARLKAQGATAIIVGGHSFGGNAAVYYGATHAGLLGVVVLAAAFDAKTTAALPQIADSLAKARRLIAEGKGDETTDFWTPSRANAIQPARATPKNYLTFQGPDAHTYIPDNTPKLTAPLLWVAGDRDPGQTGPAYAFDKAPPNPLSRYVRVSADHLTVLTAAIEPVLVWLKELRAR